HGPVDIPDSQMMIGRPASSSCSVRRHRLKKLSFSLLALALALLLGELTLRVVYAFRVGPSVLLYGTRFSRHQMRVPEAIRNATQDHTVMFHDNHLAGYSKYFPNQARQDHDERGELFRVTINSRGFRGRDFLDAKAPGVVRVITLGASSTF